MGQGRAQASGVRDGNGEKGRGQICCENRERVGTAGMSCMTCTACRGEDVAGRETQGTDGKGL